MRRTLMVKPVILDIFRLGLLLDKVDKNSDILVSYYPEEYSRTWMGDMIKEDFEEG